MILARKPCRSEIVLSFQAKNRDARSIAKATFLALYPDTKYFSKDNSAISRISIDDHVITIRIEADDISSLRASINSYLRLSGLCIDTLSDS
jgi:tRNA threonylcarbamoyladenosine modification (KEOPS) complex  Pcc1 subunit